MSPCTKSVGQYLRFLKFASIVLYRNFKWCLICSFDLFYNFLIKEWGSYVFLITKKGSHQYVISNDFKTIIIKRDHYKQATIGNSLSIHYIVKLKYGFTNMFYSNLIIWNQVYKATENQVFQYGDLRLNLTRKLSYIMVFWDVLVHDYKVDRHIEKTIILILKSPLYYPFFLYGIKVIPKFILICEFNVVRDPNYFKWGL